MRCICEHSHDQHTAVTVEEVTLFTTPRGRGYQGIIEGLCPTCGTALDRRADHGWCPNCQCGWALAGNVLSLVIAVRDVEWPRLGPGYRETTDGRPT